MVSQTRWWINLTELSIVRNHVETGPGTTWRKIRLAGTLGEIPLRRCDSTTSELAVFTIQKYDEVDPPP